MIQSCLILFAAQSSPGLLTYETPAKPLSAIVSDLATATGRPLRVAPVLAGELLIVRLGAADPDQALAKVADSVFGEWQKIRDEIVLVSDSRKKEARRREFVAWQSAAIDAGIADSSKDVGQPFAGLLSKYNQAEAQAAQAERAGDTQHAHRIRSENPAPQPEQRLLLRLLAGIASSSRTSPDPGGNIEFSWPLRTGSRPFGANAAKAVQIYLDEVRESRPSDAQPPQIQRVTVRLPEPGDPLVQGVTARTSLAKISVMYPKASYSGTATLYADSAVRPAPRAEFIKRLGDSKLLLSSKSALVSRHIAGDKTIGEADRSIILSQNLKPESHEPLTFFASDGWLSLAKSAKCNLVVNPRDAWWPGEPGIADNMPLGEVAKRLWCPEVSLENGWIVGKPMSPEMGNRHRLDRKATARFVQATSQSPTMELLPFLPLAAAIGGTHYPRHLSRYAYLALRPGLEVSISDTATWSTYAMVGSLTVAQEDILLQSETLPAKSISPRAQEAFARALRAAPESDLPSAQDLREGRVESDSFRTEGLFQDMPRGAFFSVTFQSCDRLARTLRNSGPEDRAKILAARYQPGNEKYLNLRLIAGNAYQTLEMVVHPPIDPQSWKNYAQMPQSIRDEIDTLMRKGE